MSEHREYKVQFLVRVSVKAPDIETASNAPGIEVTAFNRPGQTPVEITDVSSEWDTPSGGMKRPAKWSKSGARTAQILAMMKRKRDDE